MDKARFIMNNQDEDGGWWFKDSTKYLDCFAHEFMSLSVNEKLNRLGILINEGFSLPRFVKKYCKNHSPHIVEAVHPSLLLYVQKMRWGEMYHFTDICFDDVPVDVLAQLVEDEIKLRYVDYSCEVVCSRWDESISDVMVERAEGSREKFIGILCSTDFTKEFKNVNKI